MILKELLETLAPNERVFLKDKNDKDITTQPNCKSLLNTQDYFSKRWILPAKVELIVVSGYPSAHLLVWIDYEDED